MIIEVINDEYISKLEAVRILQTAYTEGRIQAKDGCVSVLDDINALLSADVQPIVYAHKTINVGRRSYCSNCGKLAIMEDFCSKCGAKVKEGDTE